MAAYRRPCGCSPRVLGEKYTLDIRPTFIDELDRAAAYIEQHLLNSVAADKLVSDYTVYYIVHDHVMEVRWFRYSRSTRGLSSNPV